ncbi:MAG: T9SS type A sorting domain-containing protein [Chitinophagales bacterium]|nr:T9SS type A sorting domain-containing protein [Bacteroidota bacterium]MCB9042308.1 T9SS type A sorting domain-containing protein [Chitinophagales bacterium]
MKKFLLLICLMLLSGSIVLKAATCTTTFSGTASEDGSGTPGTPLVFDLTTGCAYCDNLNSMTITAQSLGGFCNSWYTFNITYNGTGGTTLNNVCSIGTLPLTLPLDATTISIAAVDCCGDALSDSPTVSFTVVYDYVASAGNCPAAPTLTSCASPLVISAIPYTHTSTTCGQGNTSIAAQCGTSYGGGEEAAVYSFTPTSSGNYLVSLSNVTGTYGGVFFHDGSCTGACVGSNITTSSGTSASGTQTLTAGITYYIIVTTWASPSCSDYTLSITPPPPPAVNDECTNAVPLSVGSGACANPVLGTNSGSTDSPSTNPTCASYGGSTLYGDVWYSVVVPASGNLVLETSNASGDYDTGMAAFSGTCGGTLTEIECDDDDGAGLFSRLDLTGQTPGATLLVSVWEYGNNALISFNVCAYDTSVAVVYDCPALMLNIGSPCDDGNPNTTNDTVTASCTCVGTFSGTCPADYTLIGTETGTADYETDGQILSLQVIEPGATIDYDSGTYIDLLSGFWAKAGCTFDAFIDGCNGSGGVVLMPASEEVPIASKTAAMENSLEDLRVGVAPNPAQNEAIVYITSAEGTNASITVYDVQGRIVNTLTNNMLEKGNVYQVKLNTETLPNGIYHLQILTSNGEQKTERLLIQH